MPRARKAKEGTKPYAKPTKSPAKHKPKSSPKPASGASGASSTGYNRPLLVEEVAKIWIVQRNQC